MRVFIAHLLSRQLTRFSASTSIVHVTVCDIVHIILAILFSLFVRIATMTFLLDTKSSFTWSSEVVLGIYRAPLEHYKKL